MVQRTQVGADVQRRTLRCKCVPHLDPPTEQLDVVRENTSNGRCADCDDDQPTVAILSWLLVICKKCAGKRSLMIPLALLSLLRCCSSSIAVHRSLTSDSLHLLSFTASTCDADLIELLRDYGNQHSNRLLENHSLGLLKPTSNSSHVEREQYIRKKYVDKLYLQPLFLNKTNKCLSQEQLNQMLYENVETSDCGKTLHLLMLGANPNYSQKMFAVADHAKRHQQVKQMKLVLANGGNRRVFH